MAKQKMNPVVHFEMSAKDKNRAASFYAKVFGWEMQHMGEEYGGYIMAITTESTKSGPKQKGVINGGLYESKKAEPPHLVVSVDNLKLAMNRVVKSGGKVLGKPMDIPMVGKFIMIQDTEGNRVGMLQPFQM